MARHGTRDGTHMGCGPRRSVRAFLAQVEADHGKLPTVALFPSVLVGAAVKLGQALMPEVSPAWRVFDRDANKEFFEALEVAP